VHYVWPTQFLIYCAVVPGRGFDLRSVAPRRRLGATVTNQDLIVPPHILWTRSLYDGGTTLRLVRLRLESGDVVDHEVEDHGNAVAVLPFDPVRRTALLVRILRAPAFLGTGRAALLECPAGLMEEANPAETARHTRRSACGCENSSTSGGSGPRREFPRR
jgi:hypothetical protein